VLQAKDAFPSLESTGPRHLILCCDGTGNIWGNGHDTNVVKIVRLLVKDERQVLYYDPGVGTTDNFPPIDLGSRITAYARRFVGLAFASGIYDNIGAGYEFLVNNFTDGDRICLLGFSRGAFTARSIAGIVDEFGIVRPGARAMLPLLVRTYFSPADGRVAKSGKPRAAFANDIKQNFCSPTGAAATVYFLGVWDTVASVGLTGLRITTDTNVRQKRYQHVRHAVALGEQRWKYSPRLYTSVGPPILPEQSFHQEWFTGCHSDIGGSYQDSSLSNLTLRWMIDQAQDLKIGLRFAKAASEVAGDVDGTAHDEAFQSPWWTLVGLCERFRPSDAQMNVAVLERRTDRSVWRPLWRRPLFWLFALATVALILSSALVLAWKTLDVGHQLLIALHFQAQPWRYFIETTVFSRDSVRRATYIDFVLIPVYVSLMALLVVHARHRLAYSAQNMWAARLDRWSSGLPILVTAGADFLENLGVLLGLSSDGRIWIRTVALMTDVKLAGIAAVILYVLLVPWLAHSTRAAPGSVAGQRNNCATGR
jgi:uncharacterized protein (DUF2235 family)